MRRHIYLLLAIVLLAGCMEEKKPKPLSRKSSLYTRIGGEAKLSQLVDTFVAKAATATVLPDSVREQFQGDNLAAWKKTLTERFAAVLGGPYRGGLAELAAALKERVSLTPAEATILLEVWKDFMNTKESDLQGKPTTRDEVMDKLKGLPEMFATPTGE